MYQNHVTISAAKILLSAKRAVKWRVNALPIFAVNMKHTPESCPMFNNDVKKKLKEAIGKREEVREKLGIKAISNFTSTLSHQIFAIVEAPSQQALESYLVEVGFAFWNTVEILQVQPVEDVIKKMWGNNITTSFFFF
jgi:uncharacterized protein with GYD domain